MSVDLTKLENPPGLLDYDSVSLELQVIEQADPMWVKEAKLFVNQIVRGGGEAVLNAPVFYVKLIYIMLMEQQDLKQFCRDILHDNGAPIHQSIMDMNDERGMLWAHVRSLRRQVEDHRSVVVELKELRELCGDCLGPSAKELAPVSATDVKALTEAVKSLAGAVQKMGTPLSC